MLVYRLMHVCMSSKTTLEHTQKSSSCDLICTWGLEQQLGGSGSKDPSGRQSEDSSKHLEFKAESLLVN